LSRTFEDVAAVREMVPLWIALTSPSGGGKTKSALRLAAGMQRVIGGEIFHIDTESRRALHYADEFKFRHVPFTAPFGSLDYLEAIKYCSSKGAGVTIVDSLSHEHEGPGGVLEVHAAEEARSTSRAAKFTAWQKPKAARRQLINGILQLPGCFIFCFRAKEKIKPGKKKASDKPEDGNDGMVELGWMPIAGEEFVYEMTLSLLFPPQSNGFPVLDISSLTESQKIMFKIPGQFGTLFKKPQQLDEQIGEALARWATGGKVLPEGWHQEQAKAAAASMTVPTAGAAVKPETGPDVSAPCPLCKNNAPHCSMCNIEMLWRPAENHPKYGPRPGRWYCPKKCTPQKTTMKGLDWHHILSQAPEAPVDDERAAIQEE